MFGSSKSLSLCCFPLVNWLEVSLSVEFYIGCPSQFLFISKVAHGYVVYPQKVWFGKVVHDKSYLKNKLGNLGPKSLPPMVNTELRSFNKNYTFTHFFVFETKKWAFESHFIRYESVNCVFKGGKSDSKGTILDNRPRFWLLGNLKNESVMANGSGSQNFARFLYAFIIDQNCV